MELLERYLHAIGRYLPDATRQDTLAELRANLLEQMDARAEETGHPLSEAEAAAILKAHGKPALVALRYLPQQSLIGPTVFPFYLLTLKRGLPLVVFVSALAQCLKFVATPHGPAADIIVSAAGGVLWSLFLTLAFLTLVFAGIEYAVRTGKDGSWNRFDPFKLPAMDKDEQVMRPKSYAKRVAGLVVHCLWMAYVFTVPWKPVWHVGSGTIGLSLAQGWAFAPVWHTFYILLVVLLSVQLIAKLALLRTGEPRWLQLATDPLGVIAIAWLAHANEYFIAAGPSVNLDDLASANQGVGIGLRVLVVIAIFAIAKKSWKYFRHRQGMAVLAF